MLPKLPVMESKTFKQSREYPEEEEDGDVPTLLSSDLSGFVLALLPRADSASSIIMIPPCRLVLAQVSSLRNSAGP